jgi:4'-phosphopantetheinyl transferase
MSENKIDVYAIDLKGSLDKLMYERLLRHVSPEKQQRIPRFYREEDRIRGLMADILARSIIMHKTGLANHKIEFYTNHYGKPFLKNRDDLHFNLSHSGSWVVGAVDSLPVGIDVERIQSIDLDISKNYFSPDEHQDLLAKEDKFSYFFTLWSLKESYIKIIGEGLSHPLNSFSIRFLGPKNIRIKEENRLLENIYFTQYEIDKDYKMAVCAYRNEFPPTVQVKTMYQLAEEFFRIITNDRY